MQKIKLSRAEVAEVAAIIAGIPSYTHESAKAYENIMSGAELADVISVCGVAGAQVLGRMIIENFDEVELAFFLINQTLRSKGAAENVETGFDA